MDSEPWRKETNNELGERELQNVLPLVCFMNYNNVDYNVYQKGDEMMGKKNYAFINSNMLIWARSQTPFASVEHVEIYKKGIKAEKLKLWEEGKELPSITEAKALASLYKVPFACFFLSAPPAKEPKRYVDRRTFEGTVYQETSYELWAEIDRVIENRRVMMDYLEEDNTYPPIPVFSADTTIDEIANTIRQFLQIDPPYRTKSIYNGNGFNYFRDAFERHGIIVSQITGVSLEEMKGLSIYYDLFPIIAVNNKDYERAKAFSLFHELAHLIRRSSSLCLIDFNERNDEEEKTCDRLAAEILMPKNAFKTIARSTFESFADWSTPCLQTIGDKFAVSTVTVVRRLHELGIISRLEYSSIYDRLAREFEKDRIAIEMNRANQELKIQFFIRYINKEGRLFPKTIISAYYKGNITYGEMCQKLNVNSKHIANMEQAVMFR